ncbi:MAG: 1-acyl-sn-glycerol-3-phosphate acyltransferase [Acidimicrobiales bacterium]|jgi:1-acyl-sn-glycerol-3-phosphate acyltransferase
MSRGAQFHFESAPELPGNERVSRYGLAIIRTMVSHLWNVTVEGVENVPVDGPALITPNHLSFCDSVFVPYALPRRAWAIGKGEYMDDWKTKHIFPAFGMIPIDRTGGKAAMDALDTAAKVLDGGHLFLIYPEGTRSRSGNLHKGRTGAARLAARCNAPIIPVGHTGTLDVQPPGEFTMKPRKDVTVRFGAPIWAQDFGDPSDPRVKRKFTDAVMFEIAALSGQDYVHTYAGSKTAAVEESATRPTAPSQIVPTMPTKLASRQHRPTSPTGSSNGAAANVANANVANDPDIIDITNPKPSRLTKPTRPTRPGS